MSFYKLLIVPLVCCLFAGGCEPPTLSTYSPRHSEEWGRAVNGLRISIKPVADPGPAAVSCAFDMAFQNVGPEDTVLALGTTVANGQLYYPHAVRVALFDEQGNARRLQFAFDPGNMRPGTMSTFAVPLSTGSIYTIRINLSDYYCPDSGEYFLELPEGIYRAFAQFEGRPAATATADPKAPSQTTLWTGRAQSNVIKFQLNRARQARDVIANYNMYSSELLWPKQEDGS